MSKPPGVICSTKTEEIDQGTLIRSWSYSPAIVLESTLDKLEPLWNELIHWGSIAAVYGNASIDDKAGEVNDYIRDFKRRDKVDTSEKASKKIFVKKKVYGDNPATGKVETDFYTGVKKRELVKRKTRNLKTIDSLVLHSTSVLRKKANDITEYFKISVHFIIVPDGTIYRLYDDEVRCNGSHGFNDRSVAVEFEGKFRSDSKNGEIGKEKPTQAQLKSGRKLIVYLKNKLPNFKYVLAHSQSSNKDCPGPEIWYNVGEWAIQNGLCLTSGRMETAGSGTTIPDSWKNGEVRKKSKLIRSFKINVNV